MAAPEIRKGMPPVQLSREEFERRYRSRYADPVFRSLQRELDAITPLHGMPTATRKAPVTRKAGAGSIPNTRFRSTGWPHVPPSSRRSAATTRSTRRHASLSSMARLAAGTTCPGEMSKSWRLVKLAELAMIEMGFAVDLLDLSRTTSEFGKQIHPCKSCVSTSIALCHWPCSCYPNYALGQTDDWMNEIYPMWVAAHGILIVVPVNWYHAPSPFKSMMDQHVR